MIAAAVVALVAVLGAGAFAVVRATGDAGVPTSRAARTVRSVDGIVVHVPEGWAPASKASGGNLFAAAIVLRQAALGARLAVGWTPAVSLSLLPPSIERRLAGKLPPAGTVRTRGGWRARVYRGLRVVGAPRDQVDVVLTPTTRGVLTAACIGDRLTAPASGCLDLALQTEPRGARVLAPSPDVALRSRLPRIVDRLNADRARARDELAAATTRSAQAAAAGTFVRAYEAAATSVRPLTPSGAGHGQDVLDAIVGARDAYAEVERSLSAGSPLDDLAAEQVEARRRDDRLAALVRRDVAARP